GRHRIGYWYWEFAEAPREWNCHAEQIQELWAPTQFIADALRKVMTIPVISMLPGVELGPVEPISRSRYGIPVDHFLFLFIYDMASIQERKNPIGLIEAFRMAFRRDDRATLVIKVGKASRFPKQFARIQDAARKAGVVLVDKTLPRSEVNGLLNACDCYVSL